MAAGIKEQIDDLDHLLDQLLKLPIDRVQAAPATILMKPRVAAIAEEEVEVEEDAPTLRFDGEETDTKPVLALAEEIDVGEDQEASEVEEEQDSIVETETDVQPEPSHSLSLSISEPLTPNTKPLTPSPSPREGEGSQITTTTHPPVQNVPVEEIPWIDDEPMATGPGKGPRVEIILGPTSNVIVASKREEARPTVLAPKRHGWMFWLFWMVTWCFDNTLGHWFPWLRRPSVKFLLGLVGVFLFAVSIYLVWTGWLK